MKQQSSRNKLHPYIFILIIPILLIPTIVQASLFYVDKNGSDSNSGTQEQPFKTIKKGVSVLSADDTLYVRAGTYSESILSWQTPIPNGKSWDHPITIAAYPGDAVTINPPPGHAFFWVKDGKAKYLIIDGFNVDGRNRSLHGFKFHQGTTHIRVQNTEIKNSQDTAILVSGQGTVYGAQADTYHEFINLHVHHNGDSTRDHGFYIQTSRNLVEGCDIHHNSSNGGKFFISGETGGGGTANYNIFRHNITHDNGTNTTQQAAGWLLSSGRGNEAYGNIAYNNDAGFTIGNNAVENLLYNNISYNNRADGIHVYGEWGGSDRAMVFNNTVYQNGEYGIVVRNGAEDTTIQNNISYKNGPDSSRNIWLHPNKSPGTELGNNVIVNPDFVDPSAYIFKLKPTSKAIDAGLPISKVSVDFFGIERVQGKAYDIGAIEYETVEDTTAPETPKSVRLSD